MNCKTIFQVLAGHCLPAVSEVLRHFYTALLGPRQGVSRERCHASSPILETHLQDTHLTISMAMGMEATSSTTMKPSAWRKPSPLTSK